MKEFKNTDELINHLKSKKVIIKDEKQAKIKIEKYSYYSIVNSYKEIFRDDSNSYKPNTTFEEIYALYEFDKNIKYIFLKYTLEIELMIKSKLANLIARKYTIKNYLELNNFDNSSNNEENIKRLFEDLNQEINNNYEKHPAIKHFKDNHGFVPPFVLTKIITFGLLSRFYGLLKQEDRQEISKNYNLSDDLMKQILINLTIVRNICAHSDRLFCFRSKYYLKFKRIDSTYKKFGNLTNLYMMIRCMEKILDKDKFANFKCEFDNEIAKLEKELVSINIKDILKLIGYNV